MGRRNKKGDPISGWVNLNKPYGMTSTQAIGKIRRALNCQKIGHAGTLDPLATGVLPIAIGEGTKTIPFVQDEVKVYRFTVTWGESRDTDDMEGKVLETSENRPTKEEIENILPKVLGAIDQIPPLFSAIKVNGRRAYDMARNGEIPDLKSRKVQIDELKQEGDWSILQKYSGFEFDDSKPKTSAREEYKNILYLERPGCNLCMGNQEKAAKGDTVMATSTRLFQGRVVADSEEKKGESLLASTPVVVLSTILGRTPTIDEYIAAVDGIKLTSYAPPVD